MTSLQPCKYESLHTFTQGPFVSLASVYLCTHKLTSNESIRMRLAAFGASISMKILITSVVHTIY